MMRKRRIGRIVVIEFLTLAVMLVLASNVFFVSIKKRHLRSGTDLNAYADAANTVHETIKALRGNVYDRNGTIIAQDNRTYNIFCILSESRVAANGQVAYVKDKEGTAEQLAKYLKVNPETILGFFQQDVYQTELGLAGRNLSQSTMEQIAALKLPGIGFTPSIQRVYPLGTFASNLIGFAQSNETGSTVGRMGAELYLDYYLSGKDGSRTYQADSKGYILPGMREDVISSMNGNNVYLTIDQNIQEALEESFKITNSRFNAMRIWGSVMEIETGKILAWGQYPSFDPNTLDIKDYNNFGAQLPYEPGSTLKTFTWVSAINEGKYNGSEIVDSGSYCFTNDEHNNPVRTFGKSHGCIYNAGRKDFGMIDYDHGFVYSSNVVAAQIQNTLITPDKHLEYLKKFGFFQSVNSDGMPEETGILNFRWPGDKLALCYGQGSTVTMLQMLQAYSAVFGNGNMVRPYYVESIRDAYDPSKIIYQGGTKVTGQPITEASAKEMQRILRMVINEPDGGGKYYQIPECEVMGKTGTTQVAINGSYQSGYTIVSLMSAIPANNPKVLVYYCFEAGYNKNAHYYTEAIKNLLRKSAQTLGFAAPAVEEVSQVPEGEVDLSHIKTVDMPNLTNHNIDYATTKLKEVSADIILLGNGKTVISQYPVSTAQITTGEKAFLLTDMNSFVMPDMTGWTRKEVTALWSVTEFGFKLEGVGKVATQSIPAGTIVTRGTEIEVVFK